MCFKQNEDGNTIMLVALNRGSCKVYSAYDSRYCINFLCFCQFMMANGGLVRVLIHTNVTKYLNFKAVDGSYVYNKGKV